MNVCICVLYAVLHKHFNLACMYVEQLFKNCVIICLSAYIPQTVNLRTLRYSKKDEHEDIVMKHRCHCVVYLIY